MSSPGWYPDPDPTAPDGRMRYWDGSTWSDQVSPTQDAPGPAGSHPDLTKRAGPDRAEPGPAEQAPQGGQTQQGGESVQGFAQPAHSDGQPGQGHGQPGQAYGQPGQGYSHQGYPSQQLPPGGAPGYEVPKPTHLPDGTALANVWKRLGAYLIDSLIISAVSIPVIFIAVMVPIGLGGGFEATRGSEPGAGVIIGMLVGYLVAFLVMLAISYWYFLHRVRQVGATFGKQWLGLQIRDWYRPGQLTWGQVLSRGLLGYLISQVTGGLFGLVDVLWCLWDPHRQTLHDKFAGTVVVDHSLPRAMPGSAEVELALAVPPQAGWVTQGPEQSSPPGYPHLS